MKYIWCCNCLVRKKPKINPNRLKVPIKNKSSIRFNLGFEFLNLEDIEFLLKSAPENIIVSQPNITRLSDYVLETVCENTDIMVNELEHVQYKKLDLDKCKSIIAKYRKTLKNGKYKLFQFYEMGEHDVITPRLISLLQNMIKNQLESETVGYKKKIVLDMLYRETIELQHFFEILPSIISATFNDDVIDPGLKSEAFSSTS